MKEKTSSPKAIPKEFLFRMAGMLGDEYGSFLDALQLPANTGLRINTLKILPEEFVHRFPVKLSAVPWCPSGFIAKPEGGSSGQSSYGKHPYHNAGLYYIQEASAMSAAQVLAPRPGETVLDLAAAPGGKATHLAAMMDNSGLLVANEIHAKRVWDLVENLERCGITNAIVTNESPNKLARHFGAYFDRVLIDAPCSGEGMFRKSEVACVEWKPELVNSCAIRQFDILEQAAQMVKPNGFLAYTTCTFSAEENEGVIARFLSRHPEFDLVEVPTNDGFQPARPEWIGLPVGHKVRRAVRIWPHLSQGEGHFIALLVKNGVTDRYSEISMKKSVKNSTFFLSSNNNVQTSVILEEFQKDNLTVSFDPARLVLDGTFIYLLAEITPDLAGLKVIRPGWWLGAIQKGRFIPSHSFAMGLKSNQAKRILPLKTGDQRLTSYYAGESLADNGDNGWVLVTVDGYPVGWGKRVQNVVKNFYPHGLRRYV